MDAYIYQAALLCEVCADAVKEELDAERDGFTGIDDEYPDGPYADGGGEADCPQHCDHCSVFLENPLTSYGYEYAREAIQAGTGNADVLAEWASFYDINIPEKEEDEQGELF